MIAPKEQKEIPFLIWSSQDISNDLKRDKKYSHQNLVPTLLRLLGVESSLYKKEMDIFP